MKRILYHLLGGAFLLFLTGCTPGNESSVPTDHLDKNILAIEKAMRIDTLETFDSLIYAKEFLVYQDSILIAVNNKYENGYFVEVYKWPSMVPIKQLYRLGDGPDEMLGAKVSLNKNELIVNDYVKSQVAVVNIDSMLKNPDFSPLPIRHQAIGSPTAIPYRGKFLLENPYSFTDRKARIIQEAPRFIITDGKEPYTEKNEYSYYTRNVTVNGQIIANETEGKIIYANMYKSSIEIYDMDLNLLKKIEGPVDLNPQYAIEGENGQQHNVAFRGYTPYAYLDYCTDDHYFYLTYVGDVLRAGQQMKDLPCWIFKFDWNGNFISSYPVHGYVLSISKSQKENALYLTTLSSEDTPILIKLHEN